MNVTAVSLWDVGGEAGLVEDWSRDLVWLMVGPGGHVAVLMYSPLLRWLVRGGGCRLSDRRVTGFLEVAGLLCVLVLTLLRQGVCRVFVVEVLRVQCVRRREGWLAVPSPD